MKINIKQDHEKRQMENSFGEHNFEIFEIDEIDKTHKVEYWWNLIK